MGESPKTVAKFGTQNLMTKGLALSKENKQEGANGARHQQARGGGVANNVLGLFAFEVTERTLNELFRQHASS